MEITIHEEKINHFTFHGKKEAVDKSRKYPLPPSKRTLKTRRNGTTIPRSVSKTNIDAGEFRAMGANLQKQYSEVNPMLSQLNDFTENKNCKKYSCES